MSSAVRACSNSVPLLMNRSATSNSRRASCSDVCVFCVPDSTNTDQYCAPTHPSRNRGMSAHSVGCTLLISNDVKSPAFVSMNIDGRSLCVSMKGALFNSALARSSNFGSGVSASSLAPPMPANAQSARTATELIDQFNPPGCDQARTAECREAGSEEQLLKEIRSLEQHVRQASGQCAVIGPNGVVGHRISNLKRNEHTSPAFLHKH